MSVPAVALTATPPRRPWLGFALATVALYLLLFLFYGRPENDYWGAVYAPLVAIGLASMPAAVLGLAVRSRRSS